LLIGKPAVEIFSGTQRLQLLNLSHKINHHQITTMKPVKFTLLTFLCASSLLLLMGAEKKQKLARPERIARGKYLVNFGGCNDCHTPLKMTDKGPVPDMTRMLSGHPESMKLPTPDLKSGPWFASTAGMTAWAGPWGISYSANLTSDVNTGIGIWTEEMFLKSMKTGKHMGVGRDILPPMPWQSVAALEDEDIKAIYVYLQTVPAIVNHVPAPQGPNGQSTAE
jgi:hypothetical protein